MALLHCKLFKVQSGHMNQVSSCVLFIDLSKGLE